MFFTGRSWHFGRDIAVVLKEVQMLPFEFFEVMSLTGFTTHWARVQAATLSPYNQSEFVRFFCDVEVLINDFPGSLKTEAEHEYLVTIHG